MHLLLLPALLLAASPSSADWTTEFERTNGRRTFTYDETIEFCRRLDKASKWVRYQSFGKSGEGRDLPVLIVDRNGDFSAEKVHKRGKAIVFVQAGIHSGEIDGKDAGLILIREMTITRERASLLDHVTFVFIPIYNVDGHELVRPYNRVNQNGPENAGFRATATFLNLNRDYMKADAPETQAWLSLWNSWAPDFFADCHVTDGADYPYVVTYVAETHATADPDVAAWTRERYVPELWTRMDASGFPLMHYSEFRVEHDPKSGLKTGVSTPRFSTGYVALANRPALLIETHMFKDYATRVRGTHAILLHTLELVGESAAELRAINVAADRRSAELSSRGAEVPLAFELTYQDSTMIDFDVYDYTAEKSEVSGGIWYRYGKTPTRVKVPRFTTQRTLAAVSLPRQYWIPPQWTETIARLDAHGIAYTRLASPRTERVECYRLTAPTWDAKPFEGRHPLKFTTTRRTETRSFPAGTVIVDTSQPRARIAAGLLEPEAPDALVKWGMFDSIFEAKEYVESYVMEGIARDMLRDDPSLAREFAEAKRDTLLSNHPDAVRTWFYQRSRYAETRVGEYPVVRFVTPQ